MNLDVAGGDGILVYRCPLVSLLEIAPLCTGASVPFGTGLVLRHLVTVVNSWNYNLIVCLVLICFVSFNYHPGIIVNMVLICIHIQAIYICCVLYLSSKHLKYPLIIRRRGRHYLS